MSEPPQRGPSVLLVEDDERLVFAMAEVLDQAGYVTRSAGDGQVAIQWLSMGYQPDVILLDVKMTFVSGLEVLQWMEEHGIRIPVVLATQEDEILAATVGASVKLTKPFTLEQLLDGIAAGLKSKPQPG